MSNYSTKSKISKYHITLSFALLPVMKAEIRQNFPLLIFCHFQQLNYLTVTVGLHRSFLLWMVYENDFGICNLWQFPTVMLRSFLFLLKSLFVPNSSQWNVFDDLYWIFFPDEWSWTNFKWIYPVMITTKFRSGKKKLTLRWHCLDSRAVARPELWRRGWLNPHQCTAFFITWTCRGWGWGWMLLPPRVLKLKIRRA